MNINLSPNTIRNWIAEVGSIAAIVLGAIPATSLPPSVRATLIAGGSIIQAISHNSAKKAAAQENAAKSSTPTPAPVPTPVPTPVPPTPPVQ